MRNITLFILFLSACATSPTGRGQLILVSDGQMNAMGGQAFAQMKGQTPADQDPALNAYVRCVVQPITEAAKKNLDVKNWEIVVFQDPAVNAFALPGGKIGVYTGILPVANTPGELAAVLGHEVGHVIARHGAERVSVQMATAGGLTAIDAFILGKNQSPMARSGVLAALGLGAQIGIALPHSRTQEAEADLIGLRLMAEAGFNPQESVDLWHHMTAAAGQQPPQWLSTHPANEARIASLQEHMPEALGLYKEAKAAGRRPSCSPPPLKSSKTLAPSTPLR